MESFSPLDGKGRHVCSLTRLHDVWWNAPIPRQHAQQKKHGMSVTVDVTHARKMEQVWRTAAKSLHLPVTSRPSKDGLVILCDGARRELDSAALVMPAGAHTLSVSKLDGSFHLMSKASVARRIKLLDRMCDVLTLSNDCGADHTNDGDCTGVAGTAAVVTASVIRGQLRRCYFSHVPRTWVLPLDARMLRRTCNRKSFKGGDDEASLAPPRLVLAKPANLNQGRGITVHEAEDFIRRYDLRYGGTALRADPKGFNRKTGSASDDTESELGNVVQEYIEPPLLVDGHKVDLRLYLIVESLDPPRAFLSKQGLVRASAIAYHRDHSSPASQRSNTMDKCDDDSFELGRHLTNYSLQKNSASFVKPDPKGEAGHKRSLSSIWATLSAKMHAYSSASQSSPASTPRSESHSGTPAEAKSQDEEEVRAGNEYFDHARREWSSRYSAEENRRDGEWELNELWQEIKDVTRLAFLAILPWLKREAAAKRCRQERDKKRSLQHFQIIGVDVLVRDALGTRYDGEEISLESAESKKTPTSKSARSKEQRFSAHLLELNCNPSLTATDDQGNPSELDGAIKGRVTAAALALAAAAVRFASLQRRSEQGDIPDRDDSISCATIGDALGFEPRHEEERQAIAKAFFLDDIFADVTVCASDFGASHDAASLSRKSDILLPILMDAVKAIEVICAIFDEVVLQGLDGARAMAKGMLGPKATQVALRLAFLRLLSPQIATEYISGVDIPPKESAEQSRQTMHGSKEMRVTRPTYLTCEDFSDLCVGEVLRALRASHGTSTTSTAPPNKQKI